MRVRNLPPGTQEPLLQQALEKHANVKRVEVFLDLGEAEVELENAAVRHARIVSYFMLTLTDVYLSSYPQEVGKLLLRPDSIVFNGKTLQIVAESATGPATSSRPLAPPAANSGLFVPRSAVSRPRAGLGSKQRGLGTARVSGLAAASTSSAPLNAASGGAGKGQDDFRKMLLGGK